MEAQRGLWLYKAIIVPITIQTPNPLVMSLTMDHSSPSFSSEYLDSSPIIKPVIK